MDELFNELKANTTTNTLKRIEKEAEYKATRHQKFMEANKKFENEILVNYEEKMKNASDDGYSYCVLHEFTNDDMIDDVKKIFLMKGPMYNYGKGNGLSYFLNMNITPIISLIRDKFNPFRIEVKYNKNQKVNKVIIYW